MATVISAEPEVELSGSLGQSRKQSQDYLVWVSVPEEDILEMAIDALRKQGEADQVREEKYRERWGMP
ncbi:MAG TPA: hypothetical protein VNQ76_00405 [Planctomicrobium sp.]|nr:hypothetical protein [Planctomicrobium sp.]